MSDPQTWTVDRATSKEMAERMDCTVQAVDKHAAKAGIEKGADKKYDAKRLEASMIEGRKMDKRMGSMGHATESIGLLEWKTRLEEQKTRKLERENDIDEKKLAWVADVEAVWARVCQSVVADVLSACQSVAPRLEGLSVRAMASKLEETMKDALRHIAEKKPDEI